MCDRTATALLRLLLMPMWVLCLPLRYETMIIFKSFRLCHSSCYSLLQMTFVCFLCGLFFVTIFASMYIRMCACERLSLMCIKFACFLVLTLYRSATQATLLPLFAIYFIESSHYFAHFHSNALTQKKNPAIILAHSFKWYCRDSFAIPHDKYSMRIIFLFRWFPNGSVSSHKWRNYKLKLPKT